LLGDGNPGATSGDSLEAHRAAADRMQPPATPVASEGTFAAFARREARLLDVLDRARRKRRRGGAGASRPPSHATRCSEHRSANPRGPRCARNKPTLHRRGIFPYVPRSPPHRRVLCGNPRKKSDREKLIARAGSLASLTSMLPGRASHASHARLVGEAPST
jgi:hypothetical protein